MTAITSKQFGNNFIDYIEDMVAHPENYKGWRTGIPDLDNIIGGVLRHRFYVVGGKQKGGKSAFLLTVCIALNKQGVKVLYISLEMDNIEVAARVFSNVSGVEMTKFRDVTVSQYDLSELKRTNALVESFPGYWDYGTGDLKKINELIDQIQPDVIILDYFQLMDTDGSNRQESLAAMSRRLKKITLRKTGKAPTVIVASQINRASIRSGQYDANAFLDTGALERDCDVALMIQEIKDDAGDEVSNQRKIKIVASRVSGTGEVNVYFNGARSLMASAIPEGTNVRDFWYTRRGGNDEQDT